MPPLFAIERLRVAFPGRGGWLPAVRGVSLEIDRGEMVGLVGESGSGKSLTALAAVGLVPPPGRVVGGAIRLDGTDLLGSSERVTRARGRRIGLIFQQPTAALDPVFSIGFQLTEAIRAHRQVSRSAAREEAIQFLERVSFPMATERFETCAHQLSGGECQRVMIALALAGRPDLLIADEPTTALDVTIQAQILELLERLRAEMGLAILLITHDLAVVAETCDRVAAIYAGRIVEEGSADVLFRSPSHPYTRALLAATPVLGGGRRGRFETLPGRVPAPGPLPGGCPFHPRCRDAREECERESPPWVELAAGHASRCLLALPQRPEGGPA